MRMANTENRFQPPRTSTHRNIHTWRTFKFTEWKKNIGFFFEKVEKMNNLRRIFKQKCGSRSRMRGVNAHNKFQTPRTLRTEVIRLGTVELMRYLFNNIFILFLSWKKSNFRRILKQKCGSRSRMRGVKTHDKFQTPRTLRTGVTSRIVSGTNKTKKKLFRRFFFWNFGGLPPMRG